MNETCNGPSGGAKSARRGSFLKGCFSGCLLAFLLVVGLPMALGTIAVVKFAGAVKELCDSEADGGKRQEASYQRVWRWGDGGTNCANVVRIELSGEISRSSSKATSIFSDDDYSSDEFIDRVRFATRKDDVAGLWIDVDSPGGEVTLSDDMRHALERFKRSRRGRFVFVRFGTLACSGGYYVSTAADYIMAAPTTLTGSIGVIIGGLNAAGLAEKLGVKNVQVASAENKAMLDPLSPVNTNHVAIVKSLVDEEYARFLDLVSESRGIPRDELSKVADGRILSAKQALEAKLVDSLGYEEDALAQVEKMAKEADPEIDGVRVLWLKKEGGVLNIAGAQGLLGKAGAMAQSALFWYNCYK